jgi:hypothetical protein
MAFSNCKIYKLCHSKLTSFFSFWAVKQWEMTNLLCAHCLPANRAFQNRKSGWRTRYDKWVKWQNSHGAWSVSSIYIWSRNLVAQVGRDGEGADGKSASPAYLNTSCIVII